MSPHPVLRVLVEQKKGAINANSNEEVTRRARDEVWTMKRTVNWARKNRIRCFVVAGESGTSLSYDLQNNLAPPNPVWRCAVCLCDAAAYTLLISGGAK